MIRFFVTYFIKKEEEIIEPEKKTFKNHLKIIKKLLIALKLFCTCVNHTFCGS